MGNVYPVSIVRGVDGVWVDISTSGVLAVTVMVEVLVLVVSPLTVTLRV